MTHATFKRYNWLYTMVECNVLTLLALYVVPTHAWVRYAIVVELMLSLAGRFYFAKRSRERVAPG